LFLAGLFVTGIGLTFFTMEVWAIVSDAIDYQEKLTAKREEGTSYAIFSFFRKMGQTVAGVGFNALLAWIGYVSATDTTEVIVQSDSVNNGIYTLATLVPFIMYLLMALLMHFGYTLGKKETIELADELRERHKNDVIDA
ncbi:MAG: MFS transporter, partial [Lachnospiraceae bacterium]|nr:MFS transporter [Lachnospiraceae bacterium]